MGSKYYLGPSPGKILDSGEGHADPIVLPNGPVVDTDVKVDPDKDSLALIARILQVWKGPQIQTDCIKIIGLIMFMT